MSKADARLITTATTEATLKRPRRARAAIADSIPSPDPVLASPHLAALLRALEAQERVLQNPDREPARRDTAALVALDRLRYQVERQVERLIEFLDATLPDADLEPSLGQQSRLLPFDAENDGLVDGELDESEAEQDLSTPDKILNQLHASKSLDIGGNESGHVDQPKLEKARERWRRRYEKPADGSECVVYSPMHSEGAAQAKAMLRKLAARS